MTTVNTSFNRPKDWQAFERLTRDLFARIHRNPHWDLFGSSGQAQGGLDMIVVDIDGRKTGVQCKGRNDAAFNEHLKVKEKEFRAAISDVRENFNDLDEFVFVTTGPNDKSLKRIAITESERQTNGKRLTIWFHGWDWFEGHLSKDDHLKLAINYGLIAVIQPKATPPSEVARAIGLRFRGILATINRDSNDRVSIQSLARHLGKEDWRQLEAIGDGTADAGFAELDDLASRMGVSRNWLIKGESTPFQTQGSGEWHGPMDLEKKIDALSPRRIYFVRKMSFDGNADAVVVLQVDDVRWHVFPQRFPIRGRVGSGGQRQIFEFLCLVRRIQKTASAKGWKCRGAHLSSEDFEALVTGEIYPASVLKTRSEDPWWDDFADMSDRIDSQAEAFRSDLQSALSSGRMILDNYQRAAEDSAGHRALLEWAFLPVNR